MASSRAWRRQMRRRDFIIGIAGSAAIWPVAALAQQGPIPTIGFLVSGSLSGSYVEALRVVRDGITATGLVEGSSFAIEYRWADGKYDRLPALAAELIERRVAVIFSTGSIVSAMAAKGATDKIPVVFANGSDPVKYGLVASLGRPGKNVTGVSFYTNALVQKRLELLHELLPNVTTVAILINSNNPTAQADTKNAQEAGAILGLQVEPVSVTRADEIDAAFIRVAALKANALLVTTDALFQSLREPLVEAAVHYRVPAIWGSRTQSRAGGLVSYGTRIVEMYKVAGTYIGRILQGEKPADLPVLQPTTFELIINLKTAKAIGLQISESFLVRADEVIE
jgi:ABC-type uncharacterized transport system substrate-binding protein